VDEYIAAAVGFENAVGGGADGVLVAEIDPEVGLAVQDRHRVAGGGEPGGDRAADRAGATGDGRNSAHDVIAPPATSLGTSDPPV
jgi:hypothetical protein